MEKRTTLAVTLGDPAGIGPEIVMACLTEPEVRRSARLVLIGHPALRERFADHLGEEWLTTAAASFSFDEQAPSASAPKELALNLGARMESDTSNDAWVDVTGSLGSQSKSQPDWSMGRVQASAGRMALAALRVGANLAQSGLVDGLVTAPVSKEALHLAGEPCEGQTELLGRWAGTPGLEMLAVAKEMRVLLLTRHMPLREALSRITSDAVVQHLQLLHHGLESLGFDRPRLALAGLNPHAGEAGLLGTEELELLVPALQQARAEGLDVTGPEAPDTVFLRASQGVFDGVLALYHDQAFIPVKLHAPDDGLTVLLGLPYLRVSPAHGTAFDIAGSGQARAQNMITALLQAARWAPTWQPIGTADKRA